MPPITASPVLFSLHKINQSYVVVIMSLCTFWVFSSSILDPKSGLMLVFVTLVSLEFD